MAGAADAHGCFVVSGDLYFARSCTPSDFLPISSRSIAQFDGSPTKKPCLPADAALPHLGLAVTVTQVWTFGRMWQWLIGLFNDPHRGAPLYAFLLGFLPLPLGSLATLWFFAGAFYALMMVARGKLAISWPHGIGLSALVAGGYFLSTLISPLAFDNPSAGWLDVGTNLQFLVFVLLLIAMSQTPRADLFSLFLWAARGGVILGFGLALVQIFLLGYDRAKGGMANPIPFSNVALLAGAISLIGLSRLSGLQRLVALAAALSGVGACLLSQTRGALLALPFMVVILIGHNWPLIRAHPKRAIVFASVLIAAFTSLFVFIKLPERFEILARHLEKPETVMNGDPSSSHRAILWNYGIRAIAQRPLGYGSQNAVSEVRRIAAQDGYSVPPYSHLHNEFITIGVGRGIIGILFLVLLLSAPVFLTLRSPRDSRFGERMAFALLVSSSYAIFGMTNVLFSQDQMITFFVSAFLILSLANRKAEFGKA